MRINTKFIENWEKKMGPQARALLAYKCKVSPGTIHNACEHKTNPDLATFVSICMATGVMDLPLKELVVIDEDDGSAA